MPALHAGNCESALAQWGFYRQASRSHHDSLPLLIDLLRSMSGDSPKRGVTPNVPEGTQDRELAVVGGYGGKSAPPLVSNERSITLDSPTGPAQRRGRGNADCYFA